MGEIALPEGSLSHRYLGGHLRVKCEFTMKQQTVIKEQCRPILGTCGVLITCVLIILLAGCATTGSMSQGGAIPKASDDAHLPVSLKSNVQKADFYVDDNFLARGKIIDLLVNRKAHTIKAKPEGYNDKENFIQPPYSEGCVYSFYFMIEDMEAAKEKEELVAFKVIGYSYGKKKNLKDDYNEALVDAKVKAIERAGVKIDSITKVENFEVKSDMVEAQAKGTIEPGYEVLEVGYDENGVYKIILIGKVRAKVK